MREVEPAVVAGVAVRRAEGLRLRPGLEGAGRGPDGVRGVERVVVALGTLQQAEVLEARHAGQVGVAVLPDRLEGRLLDVLPLEAVHADEPGLPSPDS